jgi:hypothetical protein
LFYTPEKNLSWLENFLENILRGFFRLDIVYQYVILLVLVYVLVLGIIEFVKKVLIYIPRKIIGIIVLAIVLYTVIVYFKTKA